MLYIGVDLGTSACKFLLVDDKGRVLNTVSKNISHLFSPSGVERTGPGRLVGGLSGRDSPAFTRI